MCEMDSFISPTPDGAAAHDHRRKSTIFSSQTEFFFSPLSAGGQSFFSRKDSIRNIYTSLYNELRKVVTMGRHSQPGSASYLEDLLSHLSEQLCHFTQARMEMADLYEKMHSLGSQKSINSDELVTTLEAVLHKYSSKCVSECNTVTHVLYCGAVLGYLYSTGVFLLLYTYNPSISEGNIM